MAPFSALSATSIGGGGSKATDTFDSGVRQASFDDVSIATKDDGAILSFDSTSFFVASSSFFFFLSARFSSLPFFHRI